MSNTEIQPYEGSYLTQWREPEEVLTEATKAAVALKKVVSMKKDPVMFNGEQYLEREDWGTVAAFYGCKAKTTETRYVTFGNVRGWEAVAVVIDRDRNEIGRAESMCLSDEENWGDVPVYEWQDELDAQGNRIWEDNPKKPGKKRPRSKRVKTGTAPKPLFQLRSMAQTRAEAKALKGVFSWVVVLAGYKPSVAEEMTGNEQPPENEQRPNVQQPGRASEKKQEAVAPVIEKITGVIEFAKQVKAGHLWLTVDKLVVFVNVNRVEEEMRVGAMFSAKVHKLHNDTVGDYYEADVILEAPPVVAGETVPEKEPAKAVQDLIDSGQVKTAASLQEQPQPIGPKRASRIYILVNQNKDKTGLSEEIMKQILAKLPKPLTSMSDLDRGMFEQFEKIATGEIDWKPLLEE